MTRGGKRGKKKSHVTAKIGRAAQHGKTELANKQTNKRGKKAPSLFISVTSAFPALALLHDKQGVSAAERQKKIKKKKKRERDALMAKAIGRSLCSMSVFMGTLDRRVWERGLRRKGTDRKKSSKGPGWCNKSCQWRMNAFIRRCDEKKWRNTCFGPRNSHCIVETAQRMKLFNSTVVSLFRLLIFSWLDDCFFS